MEIESISEYIDRSSRLVACIQSILPFEHHQLICFILFPFDLSSHAIILDPSPAVQGQAPHEQAVCWGGDAVFLQLRFTRFGRLSKRR